MVGMMKGLSTVVSLATFFLMCSSVLAQTAASKGAAFVEPKVRVAVKRLPMYAKQEFAVDADVKTDNPFNSALGTVWVRVTSPTGRSMDIQGYYSIKYNRTSDTGQEVLVREPGAWPWRVRFAPDEPGQWTYNAYIKTPAGQVDMGGGDFAVDESTNPGYVRVSTKSPTYFTYDKGGTFFPIGENVGWPGGGKTVDYDRWMGGLKNNGANYIRVWMCSWAFAPEWSETGLGNYLERQDRLAELDYIFALAEKYGMKVLLCINNHGMFSDSTNPEWASNPYNAKNGGILNKPQEIFTNSEAKELMKRKLTYIVGRYGYSPSLMAWELFNEVDLTTGYNSKNVASWHKEMATFLKSIDPYHHLVSTSYADPTRDAAVWALPEIDFTQTHFYMNGDTAAIVRNNITDKMQQFGKPTLIGEFGLDTGGESNTALDPTGIHLHSGLWSSAVSSAAGGSMLWWWDNYVDPLNLYHHFGAVARFVRGVDMAGLRVHQTTSHATGGKGGFAALAPTLGWAGKPADPLYRVTTDGISAVLFVAP